MIQALTFRDLLTHPTLTPYFNETPTYLTNTLTSPDICMYPSKKAQTHTTNTLTAPNMVTLWPWSLDTHPDTCATSIHTLTSHKTHPLVTPTLWLHVVLAIHWVLVTCCMRHHHATSVIELCLKGWCYYCWDHQHWTHKQIASYIAKPRGLPYIYREKICMGGTGRVSVE